MNINRNLIAGLANSGWSAVVGLLVIPLYLKYLGLEAYGLIGFYITLQSALLLLDMGLSPTVNREVARNTAAGEPAKSADLLHSLATLYWAVSILIAAFVFMLAPFVSSYWLTSSGLSEQTVAETVALMGIVIACRWPISIYQGAIVGAQRLTVSSSINIIMVTISSFGAIAVLAFISPTIKAFFIWQSGVGIVHSLVIRFAAWKIIGRDHRSKFNLDVLKPIWRFSSGVGAVAITAAILMHMDKIILSKMLTLEDFARYTLAGVLASSLLILLSPVFNTIYPRFAGLIATDDMAGLQDLYKSGTRLLCATLFPAAMLIFIFSQDIILLWTGDADLASTAAPIASYLVLGFALNGVMIFPYALQLAYGNYRIPLTITTILIFVQLPVGITLVSYLGAIGGALSWLILNFLYMLIGVWLTHRYYLKGLGTRWLLQDVMVPLCSSVALTFIFASLFIEKDFVEYFYFS